ncbi:MAG: PepSY-associated TM helix domain-containing protein, partial [Bacteroidales bacterium]
MKIRKLNRILHRDLGYFFAGMVLIYSISGIALNHIHQWNPNYIIKKADIYVDIPKNASDLSKEELTTILAEWNNDELLSFYYPAEDQIKAFIKDGTITINTNDGSGVIEKTKRRPIFKELNFLHYNTPRKWWTAFSDLFAVSLIIITITGLFIIKGKNGITRRGAVLTLAGLILPIVALLLYMG